MPDKETIYRRFYAIDGMLTTLYDRLDGTADVSAVEMIWGIRDYLELAIEDVQALVKALDLNKNNTDSEEGEHHERKKT